jgi:hypothetical protein
MHCSRWTDYQRRMPLREKITKMIKRYENIEHYQHESGNKDNGKILSVLN